MPSPTGAGLTSLAEAIQNIINFKLTRQSEEEQLELLDRRFNEQRRQFNVSEAARREESALNEEFRRLTEDRLVREEGLAADDRAARRGVETAQLFGGQRVAPDSPAGQAFLNSPYAGLADIQGGELGPGEYGPPVPTGMVIPQTAAQLRQEREDAIRADEWKKQTDLNEKQLDLQAENNRLMQEFRQGQLEATEGQNLRAEQNDIIQTIFRNIPVDPLGNLKVDDPAFNRYAVSLLLGGGFSIDDAIVQQHAQYVPGLNGTPDSLEEAPGITDNPDDEEDLGDDAQEPPVTPDISLEARRRREFLSDRLRSAGGRLGELGGALGQTASDIGGAVNTQRQNLGKFLAQDVTEEQQLSPFHRFLFGLPPK